MNYSEAEDSWKSNDEWRYADKEAAWKFFFAAGKDAPQKVISAQCVKMNQYENIIFELRDQLAKAEQLWQVAQGRCDGLEEKLAKAEQRVAEACALYIHSTKGAVGSINMAEAVLSGEWRKFVKEV